MLLAFGCCFFVWRLIMKKALKKLGAGILAMAMIASLTPVTGIASLADETETGTPATTEETEKDKQEPAGKTDTDKQKETQKPSEETPKETGESETAVPKETEKPEVLTPTETEAPKETEAGTTEETEAPKETEKAEVPHESEKPAEETPKEPEGKDSNSKKNGSSETGTIPNIKMSATGKMTWDPYPNANKYTVQIDGNDGYYNTFNRTFEANSEIDDLIKSSRIKKSSSYTIVIFAYDSNDTLLATGSYVYEYNSSAEPVQPGVLNAGISSEGILTWDAYEGAHEYHLYINGRGVNLKEDQFSIDLNKAIDKMIRNGDITKGSSYEIYIMAFTTYSKAEWKKTYSYVSSAELVVPGTIGNPAISNGMLSWDTYTGATEYEVTLLHDGVISHFGRVNTNSFNINAKIDEAIEQGGLIKKSPYKIEILAYAGDGVVIAKCQTDYSYESSAEPIPPKPLETINANISADGVLSWDQIEEADTYYVVISGYQYWVYHTSSSLDLKKTIDRLIKNGDITKTGSYKIEMQAQNKYGAKIAEWSGTTFTYDSPASFISVGDLSVSITNGILTWKVYAGAMFYSVELAGVSTETKPQPFSIDLNKWIDLSIKAGTLKKSDHYPVEINAYDEDGVVIATWSENYEYNSNVDPVVVGTIKNPVISNGTLTWDPYDGAQRYVVYFSTYGEGTETTTFELNKAIDKAIKAGNIVKKSPYSIRIEAYDSDNIVIAECSVGDYPYDSQAERIECGTLNASIENGILKWEPYANAYKYILVINGAWDEDYVFNQPTPVKLNEAVYSLNSEGFYVGMTDYSITLYAYDSDGITLAKWSGPFEYVRSANPMSVAPKTAKVKYKKVRKKTRLVARSKVLTIKNANGVLSYRKLSGNKKILINAKNGVVTVKKKLKRGTYKVRVQVTTSGNAYYTGKAKTVTFKIKVK